jgi:GDP-L-fucose synthase
MKVFIAGSSGLVGSSLIRTAPKEHKVYVKRRSELNLQNEEEVKNFFSANKFDAVILAAAKVGGIGANSTDHLHFLFDNLQIQNSVIGAALHEGIENLIFLGSSCIYPKLAEQPIVEESLLSGPLEPTNEGYAIAKIAGIRLCKAIAEERGLRYFSLMPTNLYGPNDNFNLESSHVFASLLKKFHKAKVLKQNQVVVWGSGEPYREFMYVDDMAKACWHMLPVGAPGSLINVGTGEETSIKHLAQLIAETIGYRGDIVYDRSKPDGTPRKLLDVTKIRSLGWRHEVGLREGIAKTYDWYLNAEKEGLIRE